MAGADIEAAIRAAIPDAEVQLTDLAGDDDHWAAHVVSTAFAGLSRVKQHQMVYAALGGRMGGVLHALQLTTSVPAAPVAKG
jgi:stress-induced morphogen